MKRKKALIWLALVLMFVIGGLILASFLAEEQSVEEVTQDPGIPDVNPDLLIPNPEDSE